MGWGNRARSACSICQQGRDCRSEAVGDVRSFPRDRSLGASSQDKVYAGGERPRNYVTFLEATIGKIVDLDVERVHKLRKWMRA